MKNVDAKKDPQKKPVESAHSNPALQVQTNKLSVKIEMAEIIPEKREGSPKK